MRAIGLVLCVLLSACGGSTATTTTHRAGSHEIGPPSAHDRVPHPHWTTADYVARLEDPSRDAWQTPERLVEALAIQPGMRVADVGTGSGYFLPHLSRAVGAQGHVVGEDIDEGLLEYARRRVERDALTNVELRRGQPADVQLEAGRYDLVLVVDTYHHVVDRAAWLASIGRALVPGSGRLVIVEFRDGPLPVGPPPEHKILRIRVERELRTAGFVLAREHDFLRYQYAVELMRPGAGAPPPSDSVGPRSDEIPSIVLDDDMTPTEGGFPAMSADGARVALAIVDPDGLRGAPNLLVRITPVGGGAREDLPLLSVAEGNRFEVNDPTAAQRRDVQARLARITGALMGGDFHSLIALPMPPRDWAAPLDVAAHGLRLRFDPTTGELNLDETATGRSRYATTLEDVPTPRPHAGCATHAPRPIGAWVDHARRVLVLRIAYRGTDTCLAPAWDDRVTRLP